MELALGSRGLVEGLRDIFTQFDKGYEVSK
jgi:hypothetical protein